MLPVLVLLGFSSLAGCDDPPGTPEALGLLTKMLTAEREIAYQGVKETEYRFGSRTRRDFFLVDHYPAGPTVFRRWSFSGLPSRRWVEDRPRHEYWLKDRDLLLRNYRVEIASRNEIVADRKGVALEVRSRYEGRPSLRLVLDEATGLLLDFRLFDWKGRPAITSHFDTLLLDPGLPEKPEQPEPWRGGSGRFSRSRSWNWFKKVESPSPEELEAKLGFAPYGPRYLPEGFRRKATYEGYGRNRLLKTVYSDGLSWIEIYQRRSSRPEEDRVVHESTRCSRTRMTLCLDGVQISIEGRLDPEVLREVVKSLGVVGEVEP